MSEERHDPDSDSDRDSGNDEPNENVQENGAGADRERSSGASKKEQSPGDEESNSDEPNNGLDSENRNFLPKPRSESESRDPVYPPGHHHEERSQCRHHRNHHPGAVRDAAGSCQPPDPDSDLVQNFPPEVLMVVFSFLDDISLYAVAHVCKRWYQILASQTNSEQWQVRSRC
jgi:hypothetical protein